MRVPTPYREWQNRARRLLLPLAELMRSGEADMPIEGMPSDHDHNADRLESFARPFVLFAHWRSSLDKYSESQDRDLSEPMEEWFRSALVAGTDPIAATFWGYSANFHQHSVEMGLMIVGLELSRGWLWDSLADKEREQVLDWLESDVGNGHHWNNHMFFGIFVMEFLEREGRGRPSFRSVINRWFDELEGMYRSDGWFMDGMNQAFDFYNAYAWHFYGLWWIRLYGKSDTDRVDRWREYAKQFLEVYPEFFAESGEHPAFGRSITYRFNAIAPFALAQLSNASPVDPGLAREICERSIDFFMEKPIYQSQGCLSLGWHDEFKEMVESYSCGGSVYWAAKAFSPLLMEFDDPFWDIAKEELPAVRSTDFSRPHNAPGLIVRSTNGAVEIVNAGSQIASTNTRFGPYKWGKLSYRTGIGFLISVNPDQYPLDGGLTAENVSSKRIYGRHYTTPINIDESSMGCLYSLGQKDEQFQIEVETRMWWFGGWQLILHRFNSKQPALLRHGGYALSSQDADSIKWYSQDAYSVVKTDEMSVALQSVYGFETCRQVSRLSDDTGPRLHIQAPYHVLNTVEVNVGKEKGFLACLSWAGPSGDGQKAWQIELLKQGQWRLTHETLGDWCIEDDALPCL